MAGHNRKGRNKSSNFVQLPFHMMDSAAWCGLSAFAQALWLHIVHRYNGFNNGEIGLSCREASIRLNCSKDRASQAFNELIQAGFIKIGRDANFNYKTKQSRRWILTHRALKEIAPTNEWREKSKTQSAIHGQVSAWRTEDDSN